MKRYAFRNPLLALMMTFVFASQGTWALAGTTGGITGTVTDESGAPVAGASVKIVSASQSANASTDAAGKFNFLSLAPDTYTVSIEKDGYNPLAYAGVTVFADNQLTLSFRMTKALKTIAKVSATSAGNLVKSGVGSDIYSVNSQAITTSSALGGGGNLNSAYSAISSVPGAVVPAGGAGWNQSTYVRGSQSCFTGFEYEGSPVNRAFDNYNSSTESNLGLQELQVYTGGGPSSSASSGTSGFINQVFKTGTYPGYMDLSAGIGTPTYYHQAKIEAGGATPDRRFSYYVGLSGYNQGFRPLDNNNGGGLMNDPTSVYTGQSNVGRLGTYFNGIPAITAECSPGTTNDTNPLWGGGVAPPAGSPYTYYQADLSLQPNCYVPYPGIVVPNAINLTQIADRENVANFHFRIPQKNGTSDDIQLLGSSSMLNSQYYSSFNDIGGYQNATLAILGTQYCNPATSRQNNGAACTPQGNVNFPAYTDAIVYNAPFGTPIAGLSTQQYFQPDSNPNRQFGAQIPVDNRDGIFNDTGIVKLQYTHQFSSNAFARIFGYTFFSDWTQSGAQNALETYLLGCTGACPGAGAIAANYDLITHTGGGQLELVDQLNSQHLLQLTANYTSANVVRFNNTGYIGGASPIGLISSSGGTFSCWDPTTGQIATNSSGVASNCAPGGSFQSDAITGPTGTPPAGSPAANAGA
jgi:hypothetical protein